jgi:hypothetical protein
MRATRKLGSLFVVDFQIGNLGLRAAQIPCEIWAAVESVVGIPAVEWDSRQIGKECGVDFESGERCEIARSARKMGRF